MSQILNQEDYALFFDYFKGRNEDYIQQVEDKYKKISGQIDESKLKKHLNKQLTLGIYNLTPENKGSFFCIDIDIPKNELADVEYKNADIKFNYLKDNIFALKNALNNILNIGDESILYEDTGGRGYHMWVFLNEFIDAEDIVKIKTLISSIVNFDFEFFPKTTLNKKNKYGSAIKLPLGVHQKYDAISQFITIDSSPKYIESLEDNLKHLATIKKIGKDLIYNAIEQNRNIFELSNSSNKDFNDKDFTINSRPYYYRDDYAIQKMFNECLGVKNLHENSTKLNNDSIFNISNLLLSIQKFDIKGYISKLFGNNYDEKITQKNINGLVDFYPTSCKTLIRQGLCDGNCKRNKKEKNPLDKFLKKNVKTFKDENLLNEIADENNILYSFYKIKKSNIEDSLFFDKFDFDEFEKDLDINIKLISRAILQKEDIPLIGYETIEIPKSFDIDNKLETRKLSYSFIHDQIIIQSIFNIVAQYFEEQFVDNSLGYRLDFDEIKNSDLIFEDWKNKYPEFRDKTIDGLRKENVTHYLCCDIKGFYDNIEHDILKAQVKKYVNDDYVLKLLEKIIDLYEFEKGSKTGIPQGPAYARILANLYLNDFDKEILDNKNVEEYYRYVDDIFILLNNSECETQISTKIRNSLSKINLALSEKEEKELIIRPSSDESIILNRIDAFQYGVFEEYKNITELDKGLVKEFYNEIKNNNESILLGNKCSELNKLIPSFLYLVSKKTKYNEEKDFKKLLLLDIKMLISSKQFFPRRLNKIFFWLIPSIKTELNCSISEFYESLVDAHKVYFLISLYEIFNKEDKYRKVLEDILISAIKSENPLLKGFGLKISKGIDCLDLLKVTTREFVQNLTSKKSNFLITKYLESVSFAELPNDCKDILLENNEEQRYKNYLIYNLLYKNIDNLELIDNKREKFLATILQKDNYLFIVNAMQLFILCNRDSSLFNILQDYLIKFSTKKDIIIDYIENNIYTRFSSYDKSSIQSILSLYSEKIKDEQYKKTLNEILDNLIERKSLSANNDYEDNQGCYLLEDNAFFIEGIPLNKIRDINDFKESLSKLGGTILLEPSIKESKRELTITYKKEADYTTLASLKFTPEEYKSALDLIKIMVNVYRSAKTFYNEFEYIPEIDIKNILVRKSDLSIKFKTVQNSLFTRYTVKKIDGKLPDITTNNINNIAYCISIMTQNLLYETIEKKKDILKKNTNVLLFCIENIASSLAIRDRIKPISLNSFEYLVNEIIERQNNEQELFNLYINIRIHSDLFRENADRVSAKRICKALESFYISSLNIIRKVGINTIYSKKYSITIKKMHNISKKLLQVEKNIESIFSLKNSNFDKELTQLLKLLTLYSVFNIETLSFLRIINELNNDTSEKLQALNFIGSGIEKIAEEINIDYVNLILQKKLQGKDIFNEYINFSLTELFISYLLISRKCKIENNKLIFIDNSAKGALENINHIENSLCKTTQNILENYNYEKLNINTTDYNNLIKKIEKHFIFLNRYKNYHKVKVKKVKLKKTIDKIHLGIFRKTNPELLLNFPFIVDIIKNNKKANASINIYKNKIYNFTIENEHFGSFLYFLKGKFIGENRDPFLNAFKKRVVYIYDGWVQKVFDVLLICLAIYFCNLFYLVYGHISFITEFAACGLITRFFKVEFLNKQK